MWQCFNRSTNSVACEWEIKTVLKLDVLVNSAHIKISNAQIQVILTLDSLHIQVVLTLPYSVGFAPNAIVYDDALCPNTDESSKCLA